MRPHPDPTNDRLWHPHPSMVARGEKADITTAALVVQAPRPKKSKWRLLGPVALLASVFAVASLYADLPEAARALHQGKPHSRISTLFVLMAAERQQMKLIADK